MLEKNMKLHKKLEKRVDEIEEILHTKCDSAEMEDTKDLVLKLPRYEDFDTFRTYVVDSIENFASDNTAFRNDFNTHNEIIRRYDEVLSDKVSKMTLEAQVTKQCDSIRNHFEGLAAKIESVTTMVAGQKEFLNEMRVTIEEHVERKIASTAKKERLKMQQMMNPAQADYVNEEKLKKLLSLKSDKMDIDRLF